MGNADGQGAIAKQDKEKRHASKTTILLNIIRPLQLISALKLLVKITIQVIIIYFYTDLHYPECFNTTRFNHTVTITGYGENENFSAIL